MLSRDFVFWKSTFKPILCCRVESSMSPERRSCCSTSAGSRMQRAEVKWFIREVEKGLASADRGELLTHEDVGARLEKLIAEKQAHR